MKTDILVTPLKELLQPVIRQESVEADQTYNILGAHWYADGLYTKEIKTGVGIQADKIYRVEEGDFVYNRLFAWKGSFAIASSENHNCYVSNEFPTFKINLDKIDPTYLWRYFSRQTAWSEALGLSSGGTPTSRNRLKEEKLLAMEISLPPLEEQRRIVARIEELAAKIEEARGLRREAMEEGEKLDISYLSRQFDFSDSDTLPPYWNWYYLNEILINNNHGITTGPFGTLLQKSEIQLDGIPVVGIANVQRNKFSFGFNDYISLEKAKELANYKVYADDILIARSGTVGRSCVVPQGLYPDPVMSTNLIRLRLNTHLFLPELLCKLFNGSKLVESYKDAQCYGSTRTFFTQKLLLKLRIPVPPIEQQKQIIMNLNKLQERIKVFNLHQTQTSAELNALLPSILDKAFKGEL